MISFAKWILVRVLRVTVTKKYTTRERVPVMIVTGTVIILTITVTFTETLDKSALAVPYSCFAGAENQSDGCQDRPEGDS